MPSREVLFGASVDTVVPATRVVEPTLATFIHTVETVLATRLPSGRGRSARRRKESCAEARRVRAPLSGDGNWRAVFARVASHLGRGCRRDFGSTLASRFALSSERERLTFHSFGQLPCFRRGRWQASTCWEPFTTSQRCGSSRMSCPCSSCDPALQHRWRLLGYRATLLLWRLAIRPRARRAKSTTP